MQSGVFFPNRGFFYFTHSLSPDNYPPVSDTYLRKKISLSLIGISLTLVYLVILSFTEAAGPFIDISAHSGNIYIAFLIFVFAIEIVFALVKFPLDYYADYLLEHRFNLSNQTFLKWIAKRLKGALVGAVLGIIALVVFYFLLVNFPELWWLLFAAFFFLFQVVVAELFPTLILPLFYKLKPIDDEALVSRLGDLVSKLGYRMNGVFSFDLSRETKKANAALAGLGRSRKIIISDTLLENFTGEEIEVVMSHELGHLVKHHVMKGIIMSGLVSLIGFFAMARIYSAYSSALSLPLYSLKAIPFLALLVTAFGIVAMPLGNFYSRRIEHEADMFAIETTGMREEFVESMRKLGRLNMTPENPPSWIEKVFFSHPSIGHRIRAAIAYDTNSQEAAK